MASLAALAGILFRLIPYPMDPLQCCDGAVGSVGRNSHQSPRLPSLPPPPPLPRPPPPSPATSIPVGHRLACPRHEKFSLHVPLRRDLFPLVKTHHLQLQINCLENDFCCQVHDMKYSATNNLPNNFVDHGPFMELFLVILSSWFTSRYLAELFFVMCWICISCLTSSCKRLM